ncbi:MAG: glycogen synthase [Pseudomonadales bacterium]|nr:glycogen synthase [Pseudomonadales bacterium]
MSLAICAIASEVSPLAKTGGLADVASALTRELHDGGHDARLFVPLYAQIDRTGLTLHAVPNLHGFSVALGEHHYRFDAYTARLPGSRALVYLLDCPALFARDSLYTSDADEHRRFIALTRAALESCRHMNWRPDIVHCHDWHAAFAPLLIKTSYADDPALGTARSVLTIHNIGYQGVFAASAASDLGIGVPADRLEPTDFAAGQINSLKHGILYADAITTVSPTYAREILTPEFGMGLESALAARAADLTGILNGVDYSEWDPRWDRHLPIHYGPFTLPRKAALKQRFLSDNGLTTANDRTPLLGIVGRMTGQKGYDLLRGVLPELLASRNVRLAALGSGEAEYEQIFRELADAFPGRALYRHGYDEAMAHWIEAASDIFLMPSRYEPCGLNQMYSLRYGTIPIVRRTGGLADSVTHFDPLTERGDGIVFNDFDSNAIRWALDTALEWYADATLWEKIMRNAMRADFSWAGQAKHYVRLFERLAATKRA